MADTENNQTNFLEMSDEDIMNMVSPPSGTVVAEEDGEKPAADTPAVDEKADDEGDKPEIEEGADPEAEASDKEDPEDGDQPDGGSDATEASAESDGTPAKQEAKQEKQAPVEKPAAESNAAINFEAEYKRLMAPFKANGREVAIGTVDDAIALMQMGANYNKKMAALKPNLRLMKMLENNSLLDEEKLSFLIELDKKNPEAINKLVKDSNLNPMDFDAEKASGYKPKIHSVDEREMALDTILEDLQGTKSYTRTLEIVSKKWDEPSKHLIANNPQILRLINDHVDRGIYDLIHAEVEREKMFGRLDGLSDIEAYRQVGDAIQERGGFNHLGSAQGKTPAPAVVVQPKPKTVDTEKLNEKRRAASSTKSASPAPAAQEFNPLSMSDAEFAKVADGRFR